VGSHSTGDDRSDEETAGEGRMRSVVVSLDTELAWGFHDYDRPPWHRVDAGREAWRWLLDRFAAHDIPCTWAVVGHLFLDGCDGVHADHPSVDGWFDYDPGADEHTAPAWYAPSLVQAIADSDVDHEIASHTFSHVEFGDPATDRRLARAELRRSRELAEEWGLELDSLVFPRNRVGHRDVLADAGFSAYRGVGPDQWYHGTTVRPVGKGLSYAVGRSAPPVVTPTVDEQGLVDVPASLNLFAFQGPARRLVCAVTDDPVVRKVRLGLRELAGREDGVLHLWLHPNNVRTEADFERMERVLELVARYRRDYGLRVEPMRSVAARVREHTPPGAESGQHDTSGRAVGR